jgi:hypothetical protein
MNAEDSTEWRLNMWEALLPQIPNYLLLGKGYAFSSETYDENIAGNSAFRAIDASQDPLALASDFHSGPLSVVIPLGLWGVVAWLWFWIAGYFVLWRNYHYGDADLRHINIFLYASFISKCILFLFVAGSMVSDINSFTGLVGLSVAINHGVKRRAAAVAAPRPTPAFAQRRSLGGPAMPPRPALPALGG